MKERPDPRAVLDRLKGFQRDTVEYAFQRLYLDEDSSHRFLVADEVGLGKTLVARGVIAKAIDHLWDTVKRIDVLYICSNTNIARQNEKRLTFPGCEIFARASRITLLPKSMHQQGGATKRRVNIVSLTPGTSFELADGAGIVEERVLLYWLLREAWSFGNRAGPLNVFQAYAGRKRFREEADWFPRSGPNGGMPIDASLQSQFVAALAARDAADRGAGAIGLRARFDDLCDRFSWSRTNIPKQDSRDRDGFIGELRTVLAKTCLASLEPDLVILDEFQRFRHLLDGEDPAAELARDLFSYADDSTRARVLLLSATPYKMYTLAHEAEEDDHYEDFLRTVRFLRRQTTRDGDLEDLLRRYRQELYALGQGGGGALRSLKDAIEAQLRSVMSRTERLRASGAGDGMLREKSDGVGRLAPSDVRSFTHLQRVARELDQPDVIEYWKSAPYLLNFMNEYKLKQALRDRIDARRAGTMRDLLAESPDLLLSWGDVERYAQIDPRNARLEAFVESMLAHRAAETLWLPPAAPYYPLEGAFRDLADAGFTKRLVFSAWTVVPRVVATLASYEAERRIFHLGEDAPENTPEARERRKGRLVFTESRERLTGMPVLGMLYPSFALARLGDPLATRKDMGRSLQLTEHVAAIRSAVQPVLAKITAGAPTAGAEDERWYWAAPILMDVAESRDAATAWFAQEDLGEQWIGTEDRGAESLGLWQRHVDEARSAADGSLILGRVPSDLAEVTAWMALAGLSTTALRTFARLGGEPALAAGVETRNAAARVGWAFRSLFNQPEAMAVLRASDSGMPYWRRVLEYAAQGCLQSVLDEYAHLLRDFEGLFERRGGELAVALAAAMCPVIALRTSNLVLDEIDVGHDTLSRHERRLRMRFAMRLGREKSEANETGSDAVREDLVRSAFNSPFWPYALVTTSIGQEGLDFHPYCHAIVHWNLPANPVDLEQREGRVHRFKGHAIRKNIADRFAAEALAASDGDPWSHFFEIAVRAGNGDDRGLSPFWVFHGNAYVERHAPCLPLSRDSIQLENLRRSLAVYRMVFGQPRQDDLMAFLLARVDRETLDRHSELLRVSLAPPISESKSG